MTTRFVALSLVTVTAPASTRGFLPAQHHLAALALFILEQTEVGWGVSARSAAVGAGDGEHQLLAWAARQLPEHGIAIGWRLADGIVKPMLDAAREVDPEIAVPFLNRLSALTTGLAVDLALEHDAAAAPPLTHVATASGIPLTSMTAAEIETAWAIGETKRLKRYALEHAVATMRLWLVGAPSDDYPAKQAFTRWLASNGTDAGSEDHR